MKPSHAQWLKRLPALFEISAPDPQRLLRRIVMMERNIMLPVKAIFIAIILYSFDITPWVGLANSPLDVVVETVQYIFWFYILANLIIASILFATERLPLAAIMARHRASSLLPQGKQRRRFRCRSTVTPLQKPMRPSSLTCPAPRTVLPLRAPRPQAPSPTTMLPLAL